MSLCRWAHLQVYTIRLRQSSTRNNWLGDFWDLPPRWKTTVVLHLVTLLPRWGQRIVGQDKSVSHYTWQRALKALLEVSTYNLFGTTWIFWRPTHRTEFQGGRRRGLRYLPWIIEVPSAPKTSPGLLVGVGEVWRYQIPPCSHPSINTPLHNPGLE